jgi:hypothetical protein
VRHNVNFQGHGRLTQGRASPPQHNACFTLLLTLTFLHGTERHMFDLACALKSQACRWPLPVRHRLHWLTKPLLQELISCGFKKAADRLPAIRTLRRLLKSNRADIITRAQWPHRPIAAIAVVYWRAVAAASRHSIFSSPNRVSLRGPKACCPTWRTDG